ncbi:MAG TPA: glycosyltransferase [Sediminibacterium sp.]|nr:glycosyltransferase [Sediminibacterium sp.]
MIKFNTKKNTPPAGARFSIMIPSWNNLPYLQLCISSIRRHSVYPHQIIVHVNEGTDGTLEWVQSQQDISYGHSSENIGVCYALNVCRTMADTEYLLYLNDDMYVCPGWDEPLMREINAVPDKYFFFSSTAIEARSQSNCAIEKNFGTSLENFQEDSLLKSFRDLPMQDWQGATWPPNIVHRDIWDLAGGYSTEFSPGMYSDPDFSRKLWLLGVRLFKGLADSRVYHFGSLSVKRVKKNNGYYRFIAKWGMTSGTFSRYFLQRGKPFDGPLRSASVPAGVNLKSFFKRCWAAIRYS